MNHERATDPDPLGLGLEREKDGEEVFLDFTEMSRCVVCQRLITLRRLLREGCCKCGSRKVIRAGFLFERDVAEIEEEYGWDNVTIRGISTAQIQEGLLPEGAGSDCREDAESVWELAEERLHSRRRRQANARNDGIRRVLVIRDWWRALPWYLRGARSRRDVLERASQVP